MDLREGIVLKTIKYQDSSKILYILTQDGLISVLSRNSLNLKSKNYAYSKENTLIGFDIRESNKNTFDIITTGKVINNFCDINNVYQKLIIAVEVLYLAYEYANFTDEKRKLFNLVKEILVKLNDEHYNNVRNYVFYSYIFKLKLLYLLGVGLNLNSCSDCGSEDIVGIDNETMTFKCSKHSKNNNKELIEVLRILYLGKIELFNEEIINSLEVFNIEIKQFLEVYYEKFLTINKKNEMILNKIKNSIPN